MRKAGERLAKGWRKAGGEICSRRSLLGYGAVARYTFYERLKHNAHWLSDDVAGAEIGAATAHFVMERAAERREARQNYSLSVAPLEGGAMLTYSLNIE